MSAVGTILLHSSKGLLYDKFKSNVSTLYFLETSAVVCTNYTCSLHKLQP